jgi:hypothetical protein
MRRVFIVAITLVFSIAGILQAQSVNATLTGRITDPSKSVIADAKVTATNINTRIDYEGTTNDAGIYRVANLLPGTYRMQIEKPGFKTVIKPEMILHVQDVLEVNFEMALGSVAESVTVEAGAPTVELATSSISANVNATTVRELPLNGRSWTDLATLQPGVVALQTQASYAAGHDRAMRGFGAQISISGGRPQQNNYRLDGISLNDYANGGPGSVLGGNLGVDAIQEFSVLTSNYSAEYGRTSGGVVNAISRSGTNQFHGSAYEFLRNSALDARNFFDQGSIPPFRRNQFGAAAGGPIKKDRTFVFGDFEAIRQSKGITQVSVVPSSNARKGILSGGTPLVGPCPFANSTNLAPGQASVCVDNTVQKFLGLYPLANGPISPSGDTGEFAFAGQQVVSENFFTIRVDHKISVNDTLSASYMYDDTGFTFPDNFDDLRKGHHTNRQLAALEETHIFTPTLVNTARVGLNRTGTLFVLGASVVNPLAADPSLGAAPGQNAPQVSVSGLSNGFEGGLNSQTRGYFYWNSFQGYDDASLSHGAHSLKFGAGVERMQLNYISYGSSGGQFNFTSLSNFLTNQPDRISIFLPGLVSERGLRQTIFGLYVQDDWRWRPNVMLNLGLRYEMASAPVEVKGKLGSLLKVTDPTTHFGNPLFHPTLRNFEPRVGFAWDPFRTGKTAVRGGFGIFDQLPLPFVYESVITDAGSMQAQAINLPPGSFPAGVLPLLTGTSVGSTLIEQHPPRNYVMQWNLNVQRELAPSLTALVGYVGSHGVHQVFRGGDINIVIPTLTAAGYLWPSPVGSGTRINPNFGSISTVNWGGSSFYDALEVGAQKRMSHGIQIQTSYTWGKSIDTSSASITGDTFTNSIGTPLWIDSKVNRGLSDYNIGRTLVLNVTWQVPTVKSLSGPAAWLVNGWELGSIFKASDGVPFTATFGTNGDPQGLNSGDPWAFPNRLVGPGCESLVNPGNPNNYIKTQCFTPPMAPNMPFWQAHCDTTSPIYGPNLTTEPFPVCFNLRGNSGRNVLIGPGTLNLDFSIFKNNYVKRISENFNLQFRAEFFNILNRANFAVPITPDNTDIFDSTGAPTGVAGLLTSTSTTAREIQFALKLIW